MIVQFLSVTPRTLPARWRDIAPGIILALLCSGLVGCGASVKVPIADRSDSLTQRPEYIVRAGDSLYTIAWVTRSDPNDLIAWNVLSEPYLLKPGQRIALYNTGRTRPKTAPAKPRPKKKSPPKRVAKKTKPKTGSALKRERAALGPWTWPSTGDVVSKYSPKAGQQGIDITGQLGSPVRSVAAGRVVYAGTGLRGYGRLIIIKHGESHLSAYGNNAKLLVNEQEIVDSGQQVATMGQADNGRTLLHFELRHHGKPIDPTQVLPPR